MRTSTFIMKKIKNPHLNSEFLSELKHSKTEASLELYLKKPRFIEETIFGRNLQYITSKNVESISSSFFLRQAVIVADIFHKLVALSIRGCQGFNVP